MKKIIAEFSKQRSITKKTQMINEFLRKQTTEKADPKDLDLLLQELTIMHARAELYIRFLRRRVVVSRNNYCRLLELKITTFTHLTNGQLIFQSDLEVSTTDSTQMSDSLNDFDTIINNSELARGMQELLGAYLALERYFLEESVNKALGMDSLEQDQQTSSIVDDVFFIIQKCTR